VIATIEWGKLAELVWVSMIAAAVVATIFALVIFGAARAEAAHRRGAHVSAVAFGILGAASLVAFLGAVAYAVSVIVTK
jgi:hypothetical protein